MHSRSRPYIGLGSLERSAMKNEDPRLEEKPSNAIDIHKCFIAFLHSHQLNTRVSKFERILADLKASDFDAAIEHDKAIPRGGMGSLSDVYLDPKPGEDPAKTQSSFLYLLGAQHKSIARIRVYRTYDLDHPLIDLNLDNLDAATRVSLLQKLR